MPMRRTILRAALFLVGVLAVFATTANPGWAISAFTWSHKETLIRVSGAVILALGFIAWRGHEGVFGRGVPGLLLSLPAGLAFGNIAIACCLGRVVSAIQMTEASAGRNTLLLIFMGGLGTFLIIIGFLSVYILRARVPADSWSRYSGYGGILMMIVGILVITGSWMEWMYDLQRYAASSKTFSIRLEEFILETFRVAN